jgi:predicted transcriptional regulator
MTTIDQISQVLSDHASHAIDEGEALRRVHEITCGTARIPQMLCILINNAKTEIEREREVVRSLVAVLALDTQRMVAELSDRGPDSVSTAWITMHMNGLTESKAKLEAARERLAELENLRDI